MNSACAIKVTPPEGFTHLCQGPWLQIANGIHQATGTDRHHWKTELFEPNEYFEIVTDPSQALRYETEIIDSMLHTDEMTGKITQPAYGIQANGYCSPAWYVVDHPRRLEIPGNLS